MNGNKHFGAFLGEKKAMAKDDYHVIVYKILSYLYEQLKAGKPVNQEMLTAEGKLFKIPESYWQYIFSSLYNEGYITGAKVEPWGKDTIIVLEDLQITPKGIEYLTSNSFMQKVKAFAENLPGIISLFK